MNYAEATIDVTNAERGDTITIDLEDMHGTHWADIIAAIWDEIDPEGENHTEDMPEGITLVNPTGFAVHLFRPEPHTQGKGPLQPVEHFDTILEAWSDETDNDRREAMGDYLDNGSADDLSDFEEAYQGQYSSGADFAEEFAAQVGDVPRDFPSWICISWGDSWECNLRHDYWISDNGHVFRNL